jgi:hypothetical protein
MEEMIALTYGTPNYPLKLIYPASGIKHKIQQNNQRLHGAI